MTKNEIENMPAGREMDALIAEKIIGLNVVSRNHPCGYDPECGYYEATHFIPPVGSWYDEEGPVYLSKYGIYPPVPEPEPRMSELYCDVSPVLFYSTEISAAWEVVEKLSVNGTQFYVCTNFSNENGMKYFVGVGNNILESFNTCDGYADTIALAICRAALLTTLDTS